MDEKKYREAYTTLCLSLKEITIEKSISYQSIADATGMSQPNVSKILNGVYVTSVENFLKLAHAIDAEKYKELLSVFK